MATIVRPRSVLRNVLELRSGSVPRPWPSGGHGAGYAGLVLLLLSDQSVRSNRFNDLDPNLLARHLRPVAFGNRQPVFRLEDHDQHPHGRQRARYLARRYAAESLAMDTDLPRNRLARGSRVQDYNR